MPEEVASTASWMISEAPDWLTGAVIPVDGGLQQHPATGDKKDMTKPTVHVIEPEYLVSGALRPCLRMTLTLGSRPPIQSEEG